MQTSGFSYAEPLARLAQKRGGPFPGDAGDEGAKSAGDGRRSGGVCLFVLALNDLGGLAGAKRAQIPKATRKQGREAAQGASCACWRWL